MQDVESQVTVSSDYEQIHGTENSLAVAVTFAASTSVLPSARVALPTVRKQSLRQKKRANEIARVKRHKVFIRARTLRLHLLSAHGSTKGLFHGTLGGLEVAGNLKQTSIRDAFHVSRTTANLEKLLCNTPCLARSLSFCITCLLTARRNYLRLCRRLWGARVSVFDCAGAKFASTPFGKGIRNITPVSTGIYS